MYASASQWGKMYVYMWNTHSNGRRGRSVPRRPLGHVSHMRPLLLCLLSGAALAQQVPGGMHVVELHDKADANLDQLLALFASFGVGADKARPLVQKVSEERERRHTRTRS